MSNGGGKGENDWIQHVRRTRLATGELVDVTQDELSDSTDSTVTFTGETLDPDLDEQDGVKRKFGVPGFAPSCVANHDSGQGSNSHYAFTNNENELSEYSTPRTAPINNFSGVAMSPPLEFPRLVRQHASSEPPRPLLGRFVPTMKYAGPGDLSNVKPVSMDSASTSGLSQDSGTSLDTTIPAQPWTDELKTAYEAENPFVLLRHDLMLVMPMFARYEELFGRNALENYRELKPTMDAHIYSLCSWCRWRAIEANPQAIVLSGVVGTGKSVVKRSIIDYLVRTDPSHSFQDVADCLLFIEALGTRESEDQSVQRTVYGSLVDFHLGIGGGFRGASLLTTMLAKWSFPQSSPESEIDMSFVIFEILLYGSDAIFLKSLRLQRNPQHYRVLHSLAQTYATGAIDEGLDRRRFRRIRNGLTALGLSDQVTSGIFAMLASLLKLCNLTFMPGFDLDGTTTCTIANQFELISIATLLETTPSALSHALLHRTVDIRGEQVTMELTAEEAGEGTLAFVRNLYARLTAWLVNVFNSKFSVEESGRVLSVWDSYGFTCAKTNGYQEFLVNYCNEKISEFMRVQFLFEEREFYLQEGISFMDSLPPYHRDLVVRPMDVVLASLDTASAQVESTGNDEFLVRHYLFQITYSSADFADKSRDRIPPEILSVLQGAQNALCQVLFPPPVPEDKDRPTSRRTVSFAAQVQTSCAVILDRLKRRQCSWVVCIKPSFDENSRFDTSFVSHQLLSYQIPEILHSPTLYSHVQDIPSFLHRYRMLAPATWPRISGTTINGVRAVLRQCAVEPKDVHMGRRCIFVRRLETVYSLEQRRNHELHRLVSLIQRLFRRWHQEHRRVQLLTSQLCIARHWRGYRARRDYAKTRWAILKVQAWYRGHKTRIMYYDLLEKRAYKQLYRFCFNFCARFYLSMRLHHLPSMSPTCTDWESVPFQPRFRVADEILKRFFHRWRCKVYRSKINQQEYFRLREKLAASVLLKDRKAGYENTVSQPFRGDYVRIRQNTKWKKICHETGDAYVVFSDVINKVHRSSGKVSNGLLIISTKGIATLDPRSLQLRYRVPVNCLLRISVSPYCDTVCVFHLNQSSLSKHGGDFIFETRHVVELVSKLFLVYQNATGRPLEVVVNDVVHVECQDDVVELAFRAAGEHEPGMFSRGCFSPSVASSGPSPCSSAQADGASPKHTLFPSTSSALFRCYSSADGAELEAPPNGDAVGDADKDSKQQPPQQIRYHRKGQRLEVYF